MEQEYTLEYYDPSTLLVINKEGKIKILHTPFRVQCTVDGLSLPVHTTVYVDEVWSTEKDELQYLIFGQLYSYKFFQLQINF